jgi:hypothetical protein
VGILASLFVIVASGACHLPAQAAEPLALHLGIGGVAALIACIPAAWALMVRRRGGTAMWWLLATIGVAALGLQMAVTNPFGHACL